MYWSLQAPTGSLQFPTHHPSVPTASQTKALRCSILKSQDPYGKCHVIIYKFLTKANSKKIYAAFQILNVSK